MSPSASSRNGTPRKITSGAATELPSCSEIVATTMKIPSAESMRRSRSATSADVADLDAVDEDHARLLALAEARAALVDLERQAVLALEDVLRVDADRLGELGVQAQALEVAVEGHHVARLGRG